MKRNTIITIALLLIACHAKAQCPPKGITTHPDKPVNTEKPSKVNKFDWRAKKYKSLLKLPSNFLTSPFYQTDNSILAPFYNNPDRLPEDGWELIKYSTGVLPDGSQDSDFRGVVYVVLYNKYKGVLRVFVAGEGRKEYDGAQIRIHFDKFNSDLQTSLISNASSIFALDHFKPAPELKALSRYTNSSPGYHPHWLYADFQMMYDPCTCYYKSGLHIKVWFISKANVYIKGKVDGKLATIENGKGTVRDDANRYSFGKLTEEGIKTTKSFSSNSEFVRDQLDAIKHNDQLTKDSKAKTIKSLSLFQKMLKSKKFLRDGLKAIPIVGTIASLFDFFTVGGK